MAVSFVAQKEQGVIRSVCKAWKWCVFLPFDVSKIAVYFGTQKLVVLSMEGKYITFGLTAVNLCCESDVEGQFSVSKT